MNYSNYWEMGLINIYKPTNDNRRLRVININKIAELENKGYTWLSFFVGCLTMFFVMSGYFIVWKAEVQVSPQQLEQFISLGSIPNP